MRLPETQGMATIDDVNTNIANLEEALGQGLLSVMVDGINTTFADADDLEARLRYFKQQRDELTAGARKRPVAASINLGGF